MAMLIYANFYAGFIGPSPDAVGEESAELGSLKGS